MINPGDIVRLKDRMWVEEGRVLRVNWSDQAEVQWDTADGTTLMHKVSDLERVDRAQETLESIYREIPQLHNMTEKWIDGRWVIARPIVAPELTLWARIKNAWLVLTGRAFVVRWY